MSLENSEPKKETSSKAKSWFSVGEKIEIKNWGDYEISKVESSKELGQKLGVEMNRDVPVYYLRGFPPEGQGAYHPESDTVLIFENMTDENTIKHELVHVIEYKQTPTAFLIALYEQAKSKIEESSFNPEMGIFNFNFMKNIHEFVADGYSSEAFIWALKKEGLYDDFLKETSYLFTK